MTRPASGYMGSASAGFEWSVEPHWDDVLGTESQGAAGAALTYAAFRDTPFKFYAFRTGQSDELHLRFQLPHAWDPETEVRPHVHVIPIGDPVAAQVAQFVGQYAWSLPGVEIPADAGWEQFTASHTVSPGDVNKQAIMSLFHATPPAAANESAILLIYLKRIGADGSDTYSDNLALASIDCHYQKVKFGTLNEIPGQP